MDKICDNNSYTYIVILFGEVLQIVMSVTLYCNFYFPLRVCMGVYVCVCGVT